MSSGRATSRCRWSATGRATRSISSSASVRVQRRFQKIVEETPATNLSESLREQICSAAVRLAAAAQYRNVGTVEFILCADGRFFFLEMNTRLQVEHPVTEMITGLDLVRIQLDIAAGHGLPFRQSGASRRGHAIECRICAEDPERDFMPETGTIRYLDAPAAPFIRFENALDAGQKVTPDFDPMLAKLIVHGATRAEAIDRAIAALERSGAARPAHQHRLSRAPARTSLLSRRRPAHRVRQPTRVDARGARTRREHAGTRC